jgi:uncharacterized linocin/CFP29 family protein
MADETNAAATGGQIGVNAQIDTLQSSGDGRTFVSGTVGQRLLQSNFDIDILRPCASPMPVQLNDMGLNINAGLTVNGVLLEDEWKYFDRTVQQVARERLPAVTDLISRGLTMALPNALGVMDIQWERVKSDLVDAEVTMSGLPEATKDRQEFETVSMPVPIFHKEFYYNLRHLAAARRNGRMPEVSHAEVATRKVAEKIENVLFTGLQVGGKTIYGLTTEPNRVTGSVTASWATATGEQIVADILRMIDAASGPTNNFEGPYILYVPTSIANRFGNDYKANSDKTILSRIMEIVGIQKIIPTSRLSGTNVLLVQTTSDVVQMVDGLQPTMVEWESHGGFQHNFKIFAIMIPRVRSDGFEQSGIVHFS